MACQGKTPTGSIAYILALRASVTIWPSPMGMSAQLPRPRMHKGAVDGARLMQLAQSWVVLTCSCMMCAEVGRIPQRFGN